MASHPIISRAWAMPNSRTFQIQPIQNLIEKYANGVIVDPFANTSPYGTITNDLDPSMPTTYHLEATEFLKSLQDESADCVLYDPPYSPRQVSECYKRFHLSVDMKTTQASYWSNQKKKLHVSSSREEFALRSDGIAEELDKNMDSTSSRF